MHTVAAMGEWFQRIRHILKIYIFDTEHLSEGCIERGDLALKLMGQLQLIHTAAAVREWCQILVLFSKS